MNKIGEKIKRARKELNLSQTALAGEQMTKGMLSQIENNQAMPSMKNLQFIAEKLGKPVSYFLQEEKEPFPAHLVIHDFTTTIKKSRGNKAKKMAEQSIEELEQLLDKYDIDKDSKVYGDILLQYGHSLGILNQYDESEEKIQKAIEIYVKQHLYLEAAKASLKLSNRYMDHFQYDQCLEATNKANELYLNSLHTDNEFESEILFLKAFVYSAMGDMAQALELLNISIQNMKRLNCFFKPDETYRLTAVFYLYDEKYDDFLYYITKARQYAELAENKNCLAMIDVNMAVYSNDMRQPVKALEYLESYEKRVEEKRFVYFTQMARAHYLLGNYDKALLYASKLSFNEYVNHVFDYNHLWTGKVLEGLILHKLGRNEQGIEAVRLGIEKMEVFSPSRLLAAAYKSLGELYSEVEDYENAYKALKKADETYKKLTQ